MELTQRTEMLPAVRLRAEVAPSDATKRRARATIYTGATMERFDAFDGRYTLRLAMDGGDFTRFNAGAAVTRDHSADLDAVVGVTERAWVERGAAHALIRFSSRDEVTPTWNDVTAGLLNAVSMDVALLEVRDVTPKGGTKALLATKWQPFRLAIVSAGADPGARMTALSNEPTHPCVIRGDIKMSEDLDLTTSDQTEREKLEAKAAKMEAKRRARIQQLADHFGCGDIWAAKMLTTDHGDDELVRLAALDRHKRSAPSGLNVNGVGTEWDHPVVEMALRAEALAARCRGAEPREPARRFMQDGIVDAAKACNTKAGFDRHYLLGRHTSPARHVELALSTSDFPIILGNAAGRILRPAHESATPTYRRICERLDLPDFRTADLAKVGDFPVSLEVGEGGEIKLGWFSEAKEVFALATYGRRLHFSRKAMVNDGLGAFTRVMQAAGVRVADFENSLFYALLLSGSGLGPTLNDTGTFFNATAVTTTGGHANYTSSGTAISVDSIGVGRAMMQKQVSRSTG